jgi:acetyl esterase/lipase
MKSLLIFCLLTTFCLFRVYAQTMIPLYTGKIPNSISAENLEEEVDQKTLKNVSIPSISMYTPEKPNGTSIIVCPGGGYASLVMKKEGYRMAEYLTKLGITTFILKYRLPSDRTMADKSIGPLQDAQQAVKLLRENASKWKIDPNKIGMMGFSAGGHLVSTAGTHFSQPVIENSNNTSLRPDLPADQLSGKSATSGLAQSTFGRKS